VSLFRLVVVADAGYQFDGLTSPTGTEAEVNTAITANVECSATTGFLRSFSGGAGPATSPYILLAERFGQVAGIGARPLSLMIPQLFAEHI
jgi:hypothetical protein